MDTRELVIHKVLTTILPLTRCTAALGTGIGKTFIGLKHMDDRFRKGKRRFLVVAPKLSILDTWKSEAVKFEFDYLLPYVSFTTYLSLTKLHPEDFDVIYLDECHSLLYSHELWLSAYGEEILGLTGTPPVYDMSEKGTMVNRFCPVVFEYGVDEAVNSDILNDYNILVHSIPLGTKNDYLVKTVNKSFMTSEQKSYAYWTDQVEGAQSEKSKMLMRLKRMSNMKMFPSKLNYARALARTLTEKTLIFCNTQLQADMILPNSYHCKNPKNKENLDLFKTGQIIQMSCVQQLNEGVNIPGLKECIIMHAYANEYQARQKIGRMLRLNPSDVATIHVLMYRNTIDEKWVRTALEGFDDTKKKVRYHV